MHVNPVHNGPIGHYLSQCAFTCTYLMTTSRFRIHYVGPGGYYSDQPGEVFHGPFARAEILCRPLYGNERLHEYKDVTCGDVLIIDGTSFTLAACPMHEVCFRLVVDAHHRLLAFCSSDAPATAYKAPL